ncbi:MAG: pyridoxal phosphate-dependent aminotransferase, partial [Bacteroidota bacterium]|nr:pyridoxal phosphate-dependent aminotransferase [Bacteroidota bacterium]
MPSISHRGQAMPVSPFRKLLPFADAAKQAGKVVYPLNIGQPDVLTPPEMMEAVRNADIKVLGYGLGAGSDSYRHKLATYYQRAGIPAQFEHIMVTTAGSEAILFAMLACLNP